ncbi:MAG: hypothetical protein KC549_11470, partial [Myxococcales bacterium]|nr:hypothetical protein [Myxococcales bacterium]
MICTAAGQDPGLAPGQPARGLRPGGRFCDARGSLAGVALKRIGIVNRGEPAVRFLDALAELA